MIVEEQVAPIRLAVVEARRRGLAIGCVPTMGALHAGHVSLIEAARRESDFVIVTIFVNPTQFGPQEDFTRYPRPLQRDLEICQDVGVDLVFNPGVETIYPSGFGTFVEVAGLSDVLEGACRQGHFRGVTTVVLKLLNILQPDRAYFGRKDYQQQLIIRKMCGDLDLPVSICTCPTIREADGLALSSRNVYLTSDERCKALGLWQALRLADERLRGGEQDVAAVRASMTNHLASLPGVVCDYATVVDANTLEEMSAPRDEMIALVAARVGATRLIDNLPIGHSRTN